MLTIMRRLSLGVNRSAFLGFIACKHTSTDIQEHLDKVEARDVEFNPMRARDVYQNAVNETSNATFVQAVDTSSDDKEHVEAYGQQGSISLNAVMQSNVPEPFSTRGKAPTHLNMPGGGWSKDSKYLSDHLQQTHQSKQ